MQVVMLQYVDHIAQRQFDRGPSGANAKGLLQQVPSRNLRQYSALRCADCRISAAAGNLYC